MIYIFTCPTEGCPNNTNPVYLIDPINPVMCGSCHAYADAVPAPEPEPAPKAK